MITVEPLLKAYQEGNSLREALDSIVLQNPNHQFGLVLKKIYVAYDHFDQFDAAIAATQSIDYKTYDVMEQLIFLQFLCQLYLSADRINSARAIMATINRLVTKDLPLEWQVMPHEIEGGLYRIEGYHRKHMQSLEKSLQILGVQSGKYKVVLAVYLSQLCLINEQDKFEENLNKYKKISKGTKDEIKVDYILVLRNAENFNLELMMSYIEKVRLNGSLFFIESDLVFCEKLYQVFIKNNFEILKEENSRDWALLVCVCILMNEPQKALYWAHKNLESHLDYISQSYFASYFYIRASLANLNTVAAEYTLDNKKKFDNDCMYDDFFWFRIHHIKGNKKEAQHFFNQFLFNVDKYHLEKRFDIEVRLSPELSVSDIRYYTKNYNVSETIPHSNMSFPKPLVDNSIDFIIGESQEIKQVKDLIKKYASVDTTVLIMGETGTGKELVAKALWQAGPYKNKPYIPINCGAISDYLLQSELFGHQKGAFTGAFQNHKGVFETAEDGIVFLDEIGEISPTMQISLLRVLEAREFRPVGSNEIKKLKCKIIAATNRNLSEHVAAGKFRQDLQFRLERLAIEIPPLRKRPSDISLLVDHFLNDTNPNMAKLFFDNAALQLLSKQQWPGNIRELRNEMERIRLFYSDKSLLTIAELSSKYKTSSPVPVTKVANAKTEKDLINHKSKFRKIEELKLLFDSHKSLSRTEVAKSLEVSVNTAANYLNFLEQESFIRKAVGPNFKTNYYEKL